MATSTGHHGPADLGLIGRLGFAVRSTVGSLPGSWGLWLGLNPILPFFVTPPRQPLYTYGEVDTRTHTPIAQAMTLFVLALGTLPALRTLFSRRYDPAYALPFVALASLAMSVMALSLVRSVQLADIGLLLLGVYINSVISIFIMQKGAIERIAHDFMMGFVMAQLTAFGIALLDNNWVYGRFLGRIGPNFWGAVAGDTIMAAMFARRLWVRVPLVLLSTSFLLTTQNRSTMLALTVGFAMLTLLYFLNATPRRRMGLLLAGAVGGAALLFLTPTILDRVLLVSSERRGLGSGGTGRVEAWQQAFDLFLQNPFLGVGYRHHEDFITAASSSHQAYLATLADMGVLGLATYLLFLGTALYLGVRKSLKARSWTFACLTMVVTKYAAHGFMEQRAINFANTTSLLMMFTVAMLVCREPTLPKLRRRSSDTSRPAVQPGMRLASPN